MNEYERMLDMQNIDVLLVCSEAMDDIVCIREQLFAEYLMKAGMLPDSYCFFSQRGNNVSFMVFYDGTSYGGLFWQRKPKWWVE